MTDLNLIVSQIRQRLEILYQEIDKIEQGGGGGGGGTDDYNDLNNKPKINSVTLSGNKSLSDLGIAAAGASYTKGEVDTLLTGKADTSTTYTKTETNAEIQGAITDLDVPSTSTSGHYIKSIAQEDGKIVAVADTVQDYASASSTHPITSGAVASIQSTLETAIGAKPSISDIFGTGTALTTGQDLNNITTLGSYNANTPSIAGSLDNCPVSTAFRMEVMNLNGSTRYVQVIYTVDTGTTLATVYVRGYTTNGWSTWAKLMDNDTGVNSIVYGTSTSIDPASDTTIALADLAPGRYRITGSTAAGRVTDTPWTTSGFEIVVHNTSSSNYRVQTLYPALDANVGDKYYQRHYRGTGTGAVNGWSPWYLYEGTVVS